MGHFSPLRRFLTLFGRCSCLMLALALLLPAQAAVTWAKNFGITNGSFANDVVTDSNKNIYIAGSFGGPTLVVGGTTLTKLGSVDALVIKLDSNGNVLWAKNFGGAGASIRGRSIGVDGSGNVWFSGTFGDANTTSPAMTPLGVLDYFVIKLDSSGNVAWSKNFGAAGDTAAALNRTLFVDSSGNSFLVGRIDSNWTTPSLTKIGASDAFVVKLDNSGNVVWAKNYGGAGANARGGAVAADSAGNVYVLGIWQAANLTTPALTKIGVLDGFLFKLDSAGNTLWSRNYGGAGAQLTAGGLDVDGANNVYAGYHFINNNLSTPSHSKIGTRDALLVKVDSSGTTVWSRNYGGAGADFTLRGVSRDSTGAPHLFGTLDAANLTSPAITRIGTIDAVHLKISSDGTLLSSHNYGGAGASFNTASMTGTLNSANHIVTVGAFDSANLTTPPLTKVATDDLVVICEDCVQPATPVPTSLEPYVIPVPSGVTYVPTDASTLFGSGTSVMSWSQNGVVTINAPPGTVILNATAPESAVFQASPGIGQFTVQLPSGQNIKITPNETNTQFRLKYVTVNGVKTPVLQVIQGSATFAGSAANQIIAAVLAGDSGTTLFVAGTTGATGQSGFDSNGNRIVNVTNGTATISANGFSATTPKLLYAGETAVFDSTGGFNRARVGSYSGNSGSTGDPLSVSAGYPFQLTVNAKSPKLSGTANRLGKDLETSVLEQLTKAGYTSVSTASNGVRVFTLNGSSRRMMALGEIIVDTSRSDGVSTNTAGHLEVVSGGLVTTFVPALGSADELAALLQQSDARFTLQHRSDGAYQGQINGRDYLARAGYAVSSDSGTAGLTVNSDGSVTLRDGKGNAQNLYPTFGDLAALKNQLLKINSGYTVQTAEDGSVTATLNGSSIKLVPDWQLFEAKSQHIGEGYWSGGPQFLLRLDNYTAQGVTVK